MLCMLFSSPAFTPSYYISEPDSYEYGLALISELGIDTPGGKAVFEDTWN